jgi:hypothetical protein
LFSYDLNKLLAGSIDMHLHPGPDVIPSRLDSLDAAKQAALAGMKAIVIKNHSFPTVSLASLVNSLVPDVNVFGSICLDFEVGGLNNYALEVSAVMGAKVVWMPTFSATNSRSKMRALGIPLEGEGFSILNNRGGLVPEIKPILSTVKKFDMVLGTGHLSPEETFALVNAAIRTGISKIVITHPLDSIFFKESWSLADLKKLADSGAFIELTVALLLPSEPTEMHHSPDQIVEVIRTVGAEHCIMSTDLGELHNPMPVEGMRLFMATLLQRGITEAEIELMAKKNPAGLLGLV